MSRVLPGDVRRLILAYLPLPHILGYNIEAKLQIHDFTSILLHRGFTLDRINKYFLTPLTDDLLTPYEMFTKLASYTGDLDSSSIDFLPVDLCIQLAFHYQKKKLLAYYLSFISCSKNSVTVKAPGNMVRFGLFRLFNNDLTWTEGLSLLFEKFGDKLFLPSIINVKVDQASSIIIHKHITWNYNTSYDGYYSYLGFSNSLTPPNVIKIDNLNYYYGKLRAKREHNFYPIPNYTLTDIELMALLPLGKREVWFSFALLLKIKIDIYKPKGDPSFHLLESLNEGEYKQKIRDYIRACLMCGQIEEIRKFSIIDITNTFNSIINIHNFDNLTAEQISNYAQTYEYIRTNINIEQTRDYLDQLASILDFDQANVNITYTNDLYRTCNFKQLNKINPDYLQKLDSMGTSELLYNPVMAIWHYGDLFEKLLPYMVFNLMTNKLFKPRLFDIFDQILNTTGKTTNLLRNYWGIIPGMTRYGSDFPEPSICKLQPSDYLEYVRYLKTMDL